MIDPILDYQIKGLTLIQNSLNNMNKPTSSKDEFIDRENEIQDFLLAEFGDEYITSVHEIAESLEKKFGMEKEQAELYAENYLDPYDNAD